MRRPKTKMCTIIIMNIKIGTFAFVLLKWLYIRLFWAKYVTKQSHKILAIKTKNDYLICEAMQIPSIGNTAHTVSLSVVMRRAADTWNSSCPTFGITIRQM